MSKTELAKRIKELSELLCISPKEVWNEHLDPEMKKDVAFEELKKFM